MKTRNFLEHVYEHHTPTKTHRATLNCLKCLDCAAQKCQNLFQLQLISSHMFVYEAYKLHVFLFFSFVVSYNSRLGLNNSGENTAISLSFPLMTTLLQRVLAIGHTPLKIFLVQTPVTVKVSIKVP